MTRLRAVLLSALSLISLPASALNLMDGGTSIYGVRSAYTLGEGNYSYGFWTEGTKYQGSGNTSLPVEGMTMSFTQGVTNNFDVGMYFPGAYALGTSNLVFQHFGVALKFKMDETPATKDAVAFTLYGGLLSAPANKGVGSGSDNYGFSFDFTKTLREDYKFFANLGMESSDALSVTSSTTGTYGVDDKMFWRMGFVFPFSDTSSFNLGLNVTNDVTSNSASSMLMPSYTYTSPDKELRYHLGMGYNLSPGPNLPSTSLFMGVNYTFESPNKHIADLERRINGLQTQVDDLVTSQARQDTDLSLIDQRYNYLYKNDLPIMAKRVDTAEKRLNGHDKRLDALEKRQKELAAMKAKVMTPPKMPPAKAAHSKPAAPVVMPSNGRMRVEIINHSGDPKLLARIARRLERGGYVIARRKTEKGTQERSHVYYHNGYAKQAVSLGHALPKNQIVTKSAHLPKDVELQVVLGRDLR